MIGKQVKLFLVDGTAGGLTTAEITNWTGHVLAGPRAGLSRVLAREETHRTGVYLLLGQDQVTAREHCYVGEADDVSSRLRSHERAKDFWDRVVVITSKDTNLTKAHVRYLESSLIHLAAVAARVELENSTAPPTPALPEADASDMDFFVGQLQIVLPVLGVNAFRAPAATHVTPTPLGEISPVFHLRVPRQGIDATAESIDGEFTLLEGSRITPSWKGVGRTEAVQRNYAAHVARFQQLLDDGSIRVEGSTGVITRPVVFTSPSGAGAVVTGRSCNGRKSWVTETGLTYGAWEDRGVLD